MDSRRHRLIREQIVGWKPRTPTCRPLPPRLPRPEYALTANLVDADDEVQVCFYDACATGSLEQVASHVEQRAPSLAVMQFGMEQAAFAHQTTVVDYLLNKYGAAMLH